MKILSEVKQTRIACFFFTTSLGCTDSCAQAPLGGESTRIPVAPAPSGEGAHEGVFGSNSGLQKSVGTMPIVDSVIGVPD